MKAYLFPGQGSQFRGMGKDLFKQFPDMVRAADKILGYSIEALCLNDTEGLLDQTRYTQPALYVVNAMSYRQKRKTSGTPDFLAGHSLGEYNALEAAKVFSFESGLKLVRKRGELMNQAREGGMAAVIGLTPENVISTLQGHQFGGIDIANLNGPYQTVISGGKEDIRRAGTLFKDTHIRVVPLRTSGAFHSRRMEPLRKKFLTYLKRFKLSELSVPVISNLHARPYRNEEIVPTLAGQLTNSVRWVESMEYLLEHRSIAIEELGPGKVLTKLLADIRGYERSNTAQKLPGDPSAPVADDSVPTNDGWRSFDLDKITASPHEAVVYWNRHYPAGTRVRVKGYSSHVTTREEARLLFGFRPVLYAENHTGYFALDEIREIYVRQARGEKN